MATYYIDFDNGADINAGNLAAPWATLDKFCANARNAGDIGIVRRGMTQAVAADLVFTSSGTLLAPIVLEADFDNANWPVGGQDFANSAQTYTLAFGCKAILASGNPDFVVAEWMYESTEDNREWAYEVAGVQNSDSGTDDGADSTKLIDTGKFANTVIGTQVVNTTDAITGYVSALIDNDSVYVTLDGRPTGDGGTAVVFDNGDTLTIADQIVLFLPYKGAIAAAGKTLVRMPYNPIWNTAAGDFEVNLDADHYWQFQGLHFRGTDTNGVVEVDSVIYVEFRDCILRPNGGSDYGIRVAATDSLAGVVSKSRFFNYQYGLNASVATRNAPDIMDCLFDGNSTANSQGIYISYSGDFYARDSEFRNHVLGDMVPSSSPGKKTYWFLRNCLLASSVEYDRFDDTDAALARGYSEDHDGGSSLSEQSFALDSVAAGSIAVQSDTVDVRGGGGTTSIKVTPMTNLATTQECSRIRIFEYPIYQAAGAKTYTVYFKSDDDTDWGADPTATELWIEAEGWGSALFNHRILVKSTGTCDEFDNDDTVWDTLTVTITTLQDGAVYLRGWYCKPKEAGNDNIFFCDTKIGIA